jgi:hypothetical protein
MADDDDSRYAFVADLLHDVRIARNAVEAHMEQLERVKLLKDRPTLAMGLLEAQIERLKPQVDRLDRIEVKLKMMLKFPLGEGPPPPVAQRLDGQVNPDGSGTFVLDGGNPFYLPPRRSELFQFLASGDKDPSGKDPLVGYRSGVENKAFLEMKHPGKTFRPGYINGLIYILRKTLRANGYDPRLIQTDRQKGARLRLVRGAQGPPPPGTPRHE